MSLTKKIERLFSAVTFAEAGEFDTAREIMNSQEPTVENHKPKTKGSNLNSNNPELTTEPA
jgi:hypothetical protein